MKIHIAAIATLCASFVIAGCNVEPVQTVEWFKAHKDERNAMLEKCRNNPGELDETANCINARRAQSSITWSSRGRGIKVEPLTADEMRGNK